MIDIDKNISCKSLFLSFFKINAVTFGGGYTIVPVIRDEFVNKRKIINDSEMLDIIAVAQSGPGPMAINTSMLVGYRTKGIKGALTCIFASVLPCIIVISIMYYIYSSISKNPWIKSALECMSGAISAILFINVYQMSKIALSKHKLFGSIIFLFSFLVGYFTNITVIFIIIASGLLGLTYYSILKEA
ncbi:chromate transporter [Peptostreptococcus faecalis]|uniref:chromate transporter n=1 Tax=Peptostreptococcus faecalis TaxID=2045015 RepID=UPI000C7BC8AC|nr:chromate transporter [Peptostreptococcus faecalis]